MKVSLLRWADSALGQSLVHLFSVFVKKPRFLGREIRSGKKVLVVKLLGLGSVVLSLKLLKSLKEEGYEVHFLGFSGPAQFVELAGICDRVWSINFKNIFSMFVSLWREGFHTYVDLEPTSNLTAVFGVILGAKTRLGFLAGKEVRESLFTSLVAYSNERHMIENYTEFLNLFRIKNHVNVPWPGQRKPTSNKIVLNMNSSDVAWQREWPEEYWAHLALLIWEAYPDLEMYFTGLAADAEKVERVCSRFSSRVHNIAGKTSIEGLIEHLETSKLVVTVDSGIMHLASWMNRPLVALFGPETPRLFGPLNKNSLVMWTKLPCSPCLNLSSNKLSLCKDNQCLKRMTPENVFRSVQGFLREELRIAS